MKRARFTIHKQVKHALLSDFLNINPQQVVDSRVSKPSNLLEEFKLYMAYEAKAAELRQRVLETMILELTSASQNKKSEQELQVDKKVDRFDLSAWNNKPCPQCGHLVWVRIHRIFWHKLFHPYKKRCQCLKCYHKFWVAE